LGIVRIADTVVEFVAAATAAMNENPDSSRWLHQVDGFLAQTSWDRTWTRMMQLVASKSVLASRLKAAAIGTLRRTVMLELPPLSWAGVECTVNRVGDEYFDQIELRPRETCR